MLLRYFLSVAAVAVAWSVLDFLLHGVLLKKQYAASPQLLRPQNEMKMGLLSAAVLVCSFAFVGIYAGLFETKTIAAGCLYGLLFGITTGTCIGYATYAVMPISPVMAFAWCAGSIVECTAAGLITALIFCA